MNKKELEKLEKLSALNCIKIFESLNLEQIIESNIYVKDAWDIGKELYLLNESEPEKCKECVFRYTDDSCHNDCIYGE